MFDQFGKFLRSAFETELRRNGIDREDGENLAAHFEAKIVLPLQIFFCFGKGKAEASNRINIHLELF